MEPELNLPPSNKKSAADLEYSVSGVLAACSVTERNSEASFGLPGYMSRDLAAKKLFSFEVAPPFAGHVIRVSLWK